MGMRSVLGKSVCGCMAASMDIRGSSSTSRPAQTSSLRPFMTFLSRHAMMKI
jgi:hypothetical protein